MSALKKNTSSLIEIPENFLKELSQYLTIQDLLNLSSTCKSFYEFFSTDDIWEPIFEKFLRCICTFVDYDQGQKMGGFKYICRQICLKNPGNVHTKNLLENDNILIGSSSEKFILNLTSRKLDEENLKDVSSINFLAENELQEENNTKSSNKSNSNYDLIPEIEIATTSYMSNRNDSDEIGETKSKLEPPDTNMNKLANNSYTAEKNDNSFTRNDLHRRLKNLLIKAKKFECEEDGLAGDKTTKYALKYRDFNL